MLKKLLIFCVVVAVIIVAIWQGRTFLQPKDDEPKSELVATAERRNIESNLLLSGEVTPAFQVPVKSEVGGKLKELKVYAGQAVKKGDVLAIIDDTDLLTEKSGSETEIEGAQLSVDKSKGNYERAKALYEQKLISKEVYSNLESDYLISKNTFDKAERRLDAVNDKLNKTRLLAPADGTVLDILIDEGEVVVAAASVNSGTILMNFADLSKLLIYSHINQVDAPRLKAGQEIQVNVSDADEKPVKAHIEFIAPLATVKNNIKGFEVHALIDDNDGRLKPGMSVSMNVPVSSVSNAVSVPVAAVFRENRDRVVYVRKGKSSEKRKVVVGSMDLSFVEIVSGLEPGEQILLSEPSNAAQPKS
jgi:RND family efflux transporter MFP subunit